MDNVGICSLCGQGVASGDSFIDTGPTDWSDPTTLPASRWVPVDTDVHGWTPFVITHPVCWAGEHSLEDLAGLADESHRLLRAQLGR